MNMGYNFSIMREIFDLLSIYSDTSWSIIFVSINFNTYTCVKQLSSFKLLMQFALLLICTFFFSQIDLMRFSTVE